MISIYKKYPLPNVIIILMIILSCFVTCFSSYILSLSIKNLELERFSISINYVILYFILQIFASLILALECYIEEILKNKYKKFLRNILSSIQATYTVRDFNSENTDFLNTQINNIELFFSEYIDNIYNIVYNIVIVLGGLSIMFYMFPLLALSVIIGIVVSLMMTKVYDKVSEKRVKKLICKSNLFNSSILNIISGVKYIKINQFGEYFIKKLIPNTKKYETARQKHKNTITLFSNLTYLPTFLIDILTLFIIIFNIYKGNIGADVLAIYILLQGLIINNAESLFYNITTAKTGKQALTAKDFEYQKEESKSQLRELDDLQFKNVFFSYDDKKMLDNINIKFIKNNKYLLLGENGSGKTTIIKLLTKQISNFEYKNIFYNSISLNALSEEDIYNYISYVPQHPYIFSASLYYNIFFENEYSNEFIENILNICSLTEFVKNNDAGLTYFISNNGENISGGEKQRIAIARALVCKPKILILDEPIKNIDYISSKKIINRILKIKNLMVIIISHDMNNDIKNLCDEIIEI